MSLRLVSPAGMDRKDAIHLLGVYMAENPENVSGVVVDLTGEAPKALSEAVPFVRQAEGRFLCVLPIIRDGIATHFRYLVNVEPAGLILERQAKEMIRLYVKDQFTWSVSTGEFSL